MCFTRVKSELGSEYGDTTVMEAKRFEDGRIRRAVQKELQTPVRHPLGTTYRKE